MQRVTENIAECQLVTLEGNFAYIKTVRSDDQPSIGFVFGFMEFLKQSFPIQEYSCSQATLD
jgi:hypothetical protein